MANKKSLGRGFESLIPDNFDTDILLAVDERIQKVALDKIRPNKGQPRQDFDELALNELAGSIKQHGVLQPIILTPLGDGQYEIIAGERRWRASQKARLSHIPAIIRTAKDIEQLELAIIENVQRVDLSLLEQAASINKLRNQFRLSYPDIAKRLNRPTSTLMNIVRLLNLPNYAKDALKKGEISEGHAKNVLALTELPEAQAKLVENIKRLQWTVRQAEEFVRASKRNPKSERAIVKQMEKETDETKDLGKRLSTSVTIRRTAHGGKLEIAFKSSGELKKLINKLLKNVD